jgi:hypothetical protein
MIRGRQQTSKTARADARWSRRRHACCERARELRLAIQARLREPKAPAQREQSDFAGV